MQAAGFQLTHRFGTINDSFELSFKMLNTKIDLFFFYEDPNDARIYWNGGTQARTGCVPLCMHIGDLNARSKKFRYEFSRFTLCWAALRDLHVRVPCDTQGYIAELYGPGWRTPVSDWDWKASPSNVRPNGAWPQFLWPETIQCDDCVHHVQQ